MSLSFFIFLKDKKNQKRKIIKTMERKFTFIEILNNVHPLTLACIITSGLAVLSLYCIL